MSFVEIPIFGGVADELRPWISWMENYFAHDGFTDFQKLVMAHGFIEGEAASYINTRQSLLPIQNWDEFQDALWLRFGNDDDPERIEAYSKNDRELRICFEQLKHVLSGYESLEKQSFEEKKQLSATDYTLEIDFVHREKSDAPIPSNQVHVSNWEPCRSDQVPVFNGSLPYSWVCRVERFFRAGQFDEEDKLRLVCVSLEGAGLDWFKEELTNGEFTNWSDFKNRMLAQFAPVKSGPPSTKILKQESVSHSIQEADLSCEKDFITTPVTSCSPSDVKLQEISVPACVTGTELMPPKETMIVRDREGSLLLQSLRPICTPQSQQGERTLCEELQGAKWNGSEESLESPSVFIFDEFPSGGASATLLVHQVEQLKALSAYQLLGGISYRKEHISSKQKRLKYIKSRRFKFKIMSNLFYLLRMWWEQSLDMHQFIFGDEKLKVKHKWRFKPLHLVSDLALAVDGVVFVSYSAIAWNFLKEGSSFTEFFFATSAAAHAVRLLHALFQKLGSKLYGLIATHFSLQLGDKLS